MEEKQRNYKKLIVPLSKIAETYYSELLNILTEKNYPTPRNILLSLHELWNLKSEKWNLIKNKISIGLIDNTHSIDTPKCKNTLLSNEDFPKLKSSGIQSDEINTSIYGDTSLELAIALEHCYKADFRESLILIHCHKLGVSIQHYKCNRNSGVGLIKQTNSDKIFSLDKLNSFPNYNGSKSKEEFISECANVLISFLRQEGLSHRLDMYAFVTGKIRDFSEISSSNNILVENTLQEIFTSVAKLVSCHLNTPLNITTITPSWEPNFILSKDRERLVKFYGSARMYVNLEQNKLIFPIYYIAELRIDSDNSFFAVRGSNARVSVSQLDNENINSSEILSAINSRKFILEEVIECYSKSLIAINGIFDFCTIEVRNQIIQLLNGEARVMVSIKKSIEETKTLLHEEKSTIEETKNGIENNDPVTEKKPEKNLPVFKSRSARREINNLQIFSSNSRVGKNKIKIFPQYKEIFGVILLREKKSARKIKSKKMYT